MRRSENTNKRKLCSMDQQESGPEDKDGVSGSSPCIDNEPVSPCTGQQPCYRSESCHLALFFVVRNPYWPMWPTISNYFERLFSWFCSSMRHFHVSLMWGDGGSGESLQPPHLNSYLVMGWIWVGCGLSVACGPGVWDSCCQTSWRSGKMFLIKQTSSICICNS